MRHVILPLFAALFAVGCSLGNPAERVRYDDGIYSARPYPADAITAQARGETDLARATRDGVREPLNRRTAVTISFR